MSVKNKLVSIIIPTYNRMYDLRECINSILKSSYNNYEIIVVDNNSTDDTVAMLEDSFLNRNLEIRLIKLAENMMAAGGRNAGIKQASGEFLLFVDSDNIIDDRMIEMLTYQMEQDQAIGLLGPLMLYYRNPQKIWFAGADISLISSRTTYYHQGKLIDSFTLPEIIDSQHIPNVFMTRREIINKIGGFDNTYYIMFEESDFAQRISMSNYKVQVHTKAITYHNCPLPNEIEGNELRKYGIDNPIRAYHFAKNRSIYIKKYAKNWGKGLYFLVFVHVFCFYYSFIALRCRRSDICISWIRGTIDGIFMKANRSIYIEIK